MNIPNNLFIAIDVLIALVYIIFLIKGFKNGLIYEAINFGFLIASIIISWFVAPILGSRIILIDFSKELGILATYSNINSLINTIIWFILCTLAINLIYMLIKPLFKSFSKLPLIGTVNRILGACINLVYATLITIAISLLFSFPIFKNSSEIKKGTILKYVDQFSNVATKYIINNINMDKLSEEIKVIDVDSLRQELIDFLIEKGVLDE